MSTVCDGWKMLICSRMQKLRQFNATVLVAFYATPRSLPSSRNAPSPGVLGVDQDMHMASESDAVWVMVLKV